MFKFEFTQEEINVVLESLAAQPFKAVNQLIQRIVGEFNKQVEASKQPVAE